MRKAWLLAHLAALALGAAVRLGAAEDPLRGILASPEGAVPSTGEALSRLAELLPKLESPEARTACLEDQVALLRLMGRLEEALAALRSLPADPPHRLEQALLLVELGLLDQAEEMLAQLDAGGAGDPDTAARALYLLACVYLKTGRPALAEPLWQRLAEQHPDAAVLPAALLARYESLRARGETGKADAALAEIRQRFPRSPELALAQGAQEVRYAAAPHRLLEPVAAAGGTAAGGAVKPGPSPGPAGKALVQTGSFRDPDNARYLVRDLQKKGFDARIVEQQVDAQRYYRVVVGAEQAPADAEGVLLRLKDAGYEGVLLLED